MYTCDLTVSAGVSVYCFMPMAGRDARGYRCGISVFCSLDLAIVEVVGREKGAE